MLDYTGGVFAKLDLGFTPSPSGGGLLLLQAEEVGDAFVLMHGYTPILDSPERQEGTALITVVSVQQSVIGYPNEEAFWYDQRGPLGHGFYELSDSAWASNVDEYNRRTYGSHHPISPGWILTGSKRHFFVGSKDDSAQFLAGGLQVEVFTDRPYKAVREVALHRLDDWHQWRVQGRPLEPGSQSIGFYPELAP